MRGGCQGIKVPIEAGLRCESGIAQLLMQVRSGNPSGGPASHTISKPVTMPTLAYDSSLTADRKTQSMLIPSRVCSQRTSHRPRAQLRRYQNTRRAVRLTRSERRGRVAGALSMRQLLSALPSAMPRSDHPRHPTHGVAAANPSRWGTPGAVGHPHRPTPCLVPVPGPPQRADPPEVHEALLRPQKDEQCPENGDAVHGNVSGVLLRGTLCASEGVGGPLPGYGSETGPTVDGAGYCAERHTTA